MCKRRFFFLWFLQCLVCYNSTVINFYITLNIAVQLLCYSKDEVVIKVFQLSSIYIVSFVSHVVQFSIDPYYSWTGFSFLYSTWEWDYCQRSKTRRHACHGKSHIMIWWWTGGFLHVNVMPIGAGWQTITQLEEHYAAPWTCSVKLASESTFKAQSIWGTLEVGVASSLHPSPCFDSHESWGCTLRCSSNRFKAIC